MRTCSWSVNILNISNVLAIGGKGDDASWAHVCVLFFNNLNSVLNLKWIRIHIYNYIYRDFTVIIFINLGLEYNRMLVVSLPDPGGRTRRQTFTSIYFIYPVDLRDLTPVPCFTHVACAFLVSEHNGRIF